ncbi:hypothetical protein D9757_003870 [Collybiopsis confluens]|uniref:Helicase ATP-binding domain-containing protein n=1 Tax=Collybiopsis confluens TaxID=2823264 RepID=A0A8H5HVD7_9AGAR|nr:hypothetical protein D9757_003870 [Collybiopsis confluens]
MSKYTLRSLPQPDDTEWKFTGIPAEFLHRPSLPPAQAGKALRLFAKLIIFTPESITLQISQLSSNRVVLHEDPSKLSIASFEKFRFPDQQMSITTDYIVRMFKAGIFLNGKQYRFFGHGNSQLRGRGCYLREANTDEELDDIIYKMGDLKGIMNVAKRAKRIGLLFSGAEVDFVLDPRYVGDIEDLMSGDENFSDGCGLISKHLWHIARKKRIVFQGARYTPCVYQIRYLGYKGVVMLHPAMDREKKHFIEFRKSMKKFKSTIDNAFAVVGYSTPYAFGRLNNEIVILLSSLGISDEALLAKQQAYFTWIEQATTDPTRGFEFLASLGAFSDAERLVLDGFAPNVLKAIRKAQNSELAAFRKNDDAKKERVRMLVHKSRRLYGVCDPHRVLKEGQVHVRIMTSRNGPSTITGTEVLVVRNPCLHPGDILKLRAVSHPSLDHLVDCVVFASQGKRAAPSMSSGGDLDGDEYFVCWDPDLVPSNVFEGNYTEDNRSPGSRASGMAQTSALHNKWARYHPKKAMSSECQELNALYSQAVDGARVKIPERLRNPPEPPEDSIFILTQLFNAAKSWSSEFLSRESGADSEPVTAEEADELIARLFLVSETTISEYKLVELARKIARKHQIDFRQYISHIHYGALQTHEKYELAVNLRMNATEQAYMWNSLLRSDIVEAKDLIDKKLSGPLRVQRLYSSKDLGLPAFFGYFVHAMESFTRKLVIVKLDDRFSFTIFIRGDIPLNEDHPVDGEHVVVAAFMRESAMAAIPTFKSCTPGFQLYCGDGNIQLFNKHRSNTFIHIRKPPANSGEDFITSIALQNISARVQKQMGRVNRTPVMTMEIHVVSNRDRIAHQLFDLRFERVPTEEFLKRFTHVDTTYLPNTLPNADLSSIPESLHVVFTEPENAVRRFLAGPTITPEQLGQCANFAWQHHAEHQLFWIFDAMLSQRPPSVATIIDWLGNHPLLVFCILKKFLPEDSDLLPEPWTDLGPAIIQHIIRAADVVPIASLYALERLKDIVAAIEFHNYLELLELVTIAIRAPQQVQETLIVLHECRQELWVQSPSKEYAHKEALAVAVDRAQEAEDTCPCDEDGRIRRQRSAPITVPLLPVEGEDFQVIAHIRVDSPSTVRLHSHVRFRAASKPEKGDIESTILDGLVTLSESGEIRVKLIRRPPPEFSRIQWYLYDVGSVATFRAMMDAIRRLALEGPECCRFSAMITDANSLLQAEEERQVDDAEVQQRDVLELPGLNESQCEAVSLTDWSQVSLIWGPPGTGKTTVVIQILKRFIQNLGEGTKILMTASTHNAVDNVLERFAIVNANDNLLPTDKIIRFATDSFRVGKSVKSFTVESRVGGEIVRDSRRRDKAEKLIKEAVIVFTTCASAGLGALRSMVFDIALIDEASQITEPVGLIPLVKGCKRAVLVGDHVQLRPMVRSLGPALLYDVALFERIYKGPELPGLSKTMLNIQYRFPEALAKFPSNEFYNGKLQSHITDDRALTILEPLLRSKFPWPVKNGVVQPAVFIHCGVEEDMGGQSKSNEGQAALVKHVISLLSTSADTAEPLPDDKLPSITVLSPYTKQTRLLHNMLRAPAFTIDSFQGRESDIIIFSTVRSNALGDIGFVEDERRLNVAWTRARKALIVIGDKTTMASSVGLWQRAIKSCVEIVEVTVTKCTLNSGYNVGAHRALTEIFARHERDLTEFIRPANARTISALVSEASSTFGSNHVLTIYHAYPHLHFPSAVSRMEAVYYHGVRNFEIVKTAIPQIADDEVLIKVSACGICGTVAFQNLCFSGILHIDSSFVQDHHISEGEFLAKFPLIPGHEIVGTIAELGKQVTSGSLQVGDRCVVDPSVTCELCFFCRRGRPLLCENYIGLGCNLHGGFAEYAVAKAKKVFHIRNLTDEEATLIEPAACAVHGADKLSLPVGAEVIILGAGPTGKIVIAANKGIKTRLAQDLDVADDYIEIDRDSEDQDSQWAKIKEKYPYGFDAVVEATGSEKVANQAIDLVRRGGTILIYGVYANDALARYSLSKIFSDEITILGSFAQMHCFPRAIAYLDSGKVKVKGMVTDTFNIKDFQQALDKLTSRTAVKVVVKP